MCSPTTCSQLHMTRYCTARPRIYESAITRRLYCNFFFLSARGVVSGRHRPFLHRKSVADRVHDCTSTVEIVYRFFQTMLSVDNNVIIKVDVYVYLGYYVTCVYNDMISAASRRYRCVVLNVCDFVFCKTDLHCFDVISHASYVIRHGCAWKYIFGARGFRILSLPSPF